MKNDGEEWQRLVARVMAESAVPGLSVAVTDRDGPIFTDGMGHRDLVAPESATARTAYRWFSMTKLVTATAALRLGDQGLLDLDAPVAEVLHDLPGDWRATTRQLLTHTAGLANPLPIRWVHEVGGEAPDQHALLRGLLGRRGMIRGGPGARARYSNLGYLLAAEIIARVTRSPFEDHVSQVILDPLGMHETGFGHPTRDAAVGYLNVPRPLVPVVRLMLPAGIVEERGGGPRALRPFLVDGAGYGGLVGPATDAARLLRLHLNEGELDGVRVLDVETARSMRSLVGRGGRFDHGTGWFVDRSRAAGAVTYREHYGTGAGFWNVARIYPDLGLGIVVMTNSTRGFDHAALMTHLVQQARSVTAG